MIVAGHYPDQRRCAEMVALQAQPYDYSGPEAWGCAPPYIWRRECVDGVWMAVGRRLDELKDLDG